MLAKTHALFSLFLGIIFLVYFDISYPIVFILLMVLASYLPDIDSPKSKLGKKLFFISYPIKFIFGHRKLFHSIFLPLILFGVFYYFDLNFIGLGIFFGYLSHLIGDALSKEGIMFLYPLSKFRVKGFFRVGGKIEAVLMSLLFTVDLIAILMYFLG